MRVKIIKKFCYYDGNEKKTTVIGEIIDNFPDEVAQAIIKGQELKNDPHIEPITDEPAAAMSAEDVGSTGEKTERIIPEKPKKKRK